VDLVCLCRAGFEKEVETTNNPEFVSETPSMPRAKVRPRLVVGGDLNADYLDIPAYMRQQQD